MYFVTPVNHRIKKKKESEKINKCFDLGQTSPPKINNKTVEHVGESETKNSWCAEKDTQRRGEEIKQFEINGRIETTQTTAAYWKVYRGPKKASCHSDSSERPPDNSCMKSSHKIR